MSILMQQRSVIRYFVLCQKSNQQIIAKLVKGYGQDALSLRSVQKWAARFRAGQEDVEDDERPGRPPQTDLCDVILRFLEKNPHSSSRDISKALFTPKTTVLRLLANLGLKFYQARWIPHRLSEQQKSDRTALSQVLLEMINNLGPKQQNYLITGDESWIFWDNDHRGMWTLDRESAPINVNKMISSKKTMLSAYFSRLGFVSIEFLPHGQNFNSQFFTETILPSLVAGLSVYRPKLKAAGAHLHIDNAKPHNSQLSIQKIKEYGFIRVPQPPYSPDLSPCDFFLFGYLKSQLEGMTFFDEDSVKKVVTRILTEIPANILHSVMDEWTHRLQRCIELAGDYVS
jgi:histone-lysine N-methyltransferase SETMAR